MDLPAAGVAVRVTDQLEHVRRRSLNLHGASSAKLARLPGLSYRECQARWSDNSRSISPNGRTSSTCLHSTVDHTCCEHPNRSFVVSPIPAMQVVSTLWRTRQPALLAKAPTKVLSVDPQRYIYKRDQNRHFDQRPYHRGEGRSTVDPERRNGHGNGQLKIV